MMTTVDKNMQLIDGISSCERRDDVSIAEMEKSLGTTEETSQGKQWRKSNLFLEIPTRPLEESAEPGKKVIVAVKQGTLLATAFHPELTADTRWHSYFLKMVNMCSQEASSSTALALPSDNLRLPQLPTYDLPIYQLDEQTS